MYQAAMVGSLALSVLRIFSEPDCFFFRAPCTHEQKAHGHANCVVCESRANAAHLQGNEIRNDKQK